MKTGRSLMDLAAELTRQSESKKDYIADTRKLSVRPSKTTDGEITLEGVNGGMPLRATAHEQLSATLQIPKPYYDRMKEQLPDLLCANVNAWLITNPAKKLIRTLDNGVRAILSDRFRPLDNMDLAEAVLPKLHAIQANVISSEVTERRLYLKAVTERITGAVKVGDTLQAGLVISNSEIGSGALSISAMTYRLVCLNGAISENVTRRAHLGKSTGMDALEDSREYFRDETRAADDRAFFLKVQDSVAGVLTQERFDKQLIGMRKSMGELIEPERVQEVVEIAGKKFGFNEGERKSVLAHLIQGGELNNFGLANAITRTSQDVESYDRATELEAIGGDVFQLPASAWK